MKEWEERRERGMRRGRANEWEKLGRKLSYEISRKECK
jgi:hypothetical protein